MITTDNLVEYGDPAILAEIERLTRQFGAPYISMLSNPARLIDQLMREQNPPKPSSDDAWFREFVATTKGLNDDGDDRETGETSSAPSGQGPVFPPPLSLHSYLSLCCDCIDELKASIIAKLQSGELEAFGLRRDDTAPTGIERGRWYGMSIDWGQSSATDKIGVTYHDVAIRLSVSAPTKTIADDYADQGASTEPYLEEFIKWAEQGKVKLTKTVSIKTVRKLRVFGANRNPPWPVPKSDSLRQRIDRYLEKLG